MILDDFFTRALLAGIGMAIVAGPLGCFVIWRRLAYFGDTLAHSGLLGVTIGFILNIDLSYLLKINILLALSLLSIIFIASMTASITISKNNRLSLTSILTLPLFVPILIFSMAITDLIDFNTGRMYLFFVAYFLLNLAFSPLLTSFALKKLSV